MELGPVPIITAFTFDGIYFQHGLFAVVEYTFIAVKFFIIGRLRALRPADWSTICDTLK